MLKAHTLFLQKIVTLIFSADTIMFQNMAEFIDTIYPGKMRTAAEFLKALTLRRGASQGEQERITADPFNPAWSVTASEYSIIGALTQIAMRA